MTLNALLEHNYDLQCKVGLVMVGIDCLVQGLVSTGCTCFLLEGLAMGRRACRAHTVCVAGGENMGCLQELR